VSLVIPAYNEEDCIRSTLERLVAHLERGGRTWEIVVALDGSRDGTEAIVREMAGREGRIRLLVGARRRGKGGAVRQGMLAARGRYRIFTDADLSTPPSQVDAAVALLAREADVVVGIRRDRRPLPDVVQPASRRLLGRLFNLLVRALGLASVRDTQCGFKGFREEAAVALFSRQRVDGFAFDVELLLLARRLRLRTELLPIPWRHHPSTTIRALPDGLRMIADVLAIKWRDLRGDYRKGLRSGIRAARGAEG
jgi:dolichyl-phosphate beta-glucosyltransferase